MFLAELRQLTEYCKFGTTLDEMLRDRLVCGVQDIRIPRRLLAELKLTLQQALDLALAIEAAEKDASEIQKGDFQEGATPLNKVDTKDGKGSEIVIVVVVNTIPRAVILKMQVWQAKHDKSGMCSKSPIKSQ